MDVEQAFDRAEKILRERGYRPLFMGVKGSVVYELPGTHKDIDVRAVYAAPTAQVLSLPRRGSREGWRIVQVTEGELDFVGWEVQKFLGHLLDHNGNMVELALTPDHVSREYDAAVLRELGRRLLTKRLHAYYRGYAHNQFKRAQSQIKTGKGAIYTYREMYAGIWLLLHGEIVFPWEDLRRKIEDVERIYKSGLIAEFNMDRERITDGILARMRREFEDLNELLDEALERSPLPADYDGWEKANNWLLRLRSEGWR